MSLCSLVVFKINDHFISANADLQMMKLKYESFLHSFDGPAQSEAHVTEAQPGSSSDRYPVSAFGRWANDFVANYVEAHANDVEENYVVVLNNVCVQLSYHS